MKNKPSATDLNRRIKELQNHLAEKIRRINTLETEVAKLCVDLFAKEEELDRSKRRTEDIEQHLATRTEELANLKVEIGQLRKSCDVERGATIAAYEASIRTVAEVLADDGR